MPVKNAAGAGIENRFGRTRGTGDVLEAQNESIISLPGIRWMRNGVLVMTKRYWVSSDPSYVRTTHCSDGIALDSKYGMLDADSYVLELRKLW